MKTIRHKWRAGVGEGGGRIQRQIARSLTAAWDQTGATHKEFLLVRQVGVQSGFIAPRRLGNIRNGGRKTYA